MMMHILQLHSRYREPGGEDVVVEAERRLLEAGGHQVSQHVECNPPGSRAAAGSLAASVWNAAAARRVRAAIEAHRPDVVHVHNTWYALSPSVLSAARGRGVPVVMTVHNYRLACANSLLLRDGKPCELCIDRSALSAVRHGCYRGSRPLSGIAAVNIAAHRMAGTWGRHVNKFLVLSEFAKTRMLRIGLPDAQITIGSNFVPDPGDRTLRPSRSSEVMFVGRISQEKGLQVLLEAWRRRAPQGLRLVVAGDGPGRGALEADAPSSVEFLGRVDSSEVSARLKRARALVLPSIWYEGQPLVALEGLAAGVPIVLSDIGGLPELLGGNGAGWLTPPNDIDSLASLLPMLDDDEAVDDRGARARDRYRAAYTPVAALSRLEAAYEGVMARTAL